MPLRSIPDTSAADEAEYAYNDRVLTNKFAIDSQDPWRRRKSKTGDRREGLKLYLGLGWWWWREVGGRV